MDVGFVKGNVIFINMSNEDCEFAKYFKNLGYTYSWDWSKRDGLRWHELFKDGKLILQVEMVDLKQIIKDMCVIEDIELDYFRI